MIAIERRRKSMRTSFVGQQTVGFGIWLIWMTATIGCAGIHPPIQSSGPVVSREGVRLAVTGQSCVQTKDPDQPGTDLFDATVAIQIRNPTPDPVTVHREGFVLVTSDGGALRTQTWNSVEPLSVRAGETYTLKLRFAARGPSCYKEMQLEPASALELPQGPLKLDAVRFVPSHEL